MEGLREMNSQDGQERETFFERMKYVVVSVEVYNDEFKEFDCEGTGFFVSDTGHVLTLSHVMDDVYDAKLRIITFDKVVHDCFIINIDKTKGLALLQVKTSSPNIKFPYATTCGGEIQNGEKVYSIGHPHFLDYAYSVGQISCPHRLYGDVRSAIIEGGKEMGDLSKVDDPHGQYLAYADNLDKLYLDSSVWLVQLNNIHGDGMGGSSGMPIFNCRGHIIGIYILAAFDQCFAVHAHELKSYVNDILGVSGTEQASTSGV